jgi:hypothetical protein
MRVLGSIERLTFNMAAEQLVSVYREHDDKASHILSLGTVCRIVISFTIGRFTSEERVLSTDCIRTLMDLRASLNIAAKRSPT